MSWGYGIYDENGNLIHSSADQEIRAIAIGSIVITANQLNYSINLDAYGAKANDIILLGCDNLYTCSRAQLRNGTVFNSYHISSPLAGSIPFRTRKQGRVIYLDGITIEWPRNVLAYSYDLDARTWFDTSRFATTSFTLYFMVIRNI